MQLLILKLPFVTSTPIWPKSIPIIAPHNKASQTTQTSRAAALENVRVQTSSPQSAKQTTDDNCKPRAFRRSTGSKWTLFHVYIGSLLRQGQRFLRPPETTNSDATKACQNEMRRKVSQRNVSLISACSCSVTTWREHGSGTSAVLQKPASCRRGCCGPRPGWKRPLSQHLLELGHSPGDKRNPQRLFTLWSKNYKTEIGGKIK